MGSEATIRRERIARLLRRVIWPACNPGEAPLEIAIARLSGEPVRPSEAAGLDFSPFAIGEAWGGAWSTAWFKATGRIPEAFDGRRVVARIDLGYSGQPGFGGEALVFEGTTPLQGVNPKHNTVLVAGKARAGEPVELLLEAAANPSQREGPLEWPLLLPDYDGKPLYRLRRFDLAVVDEEMTAVLYDWTVLLELVDSLGQQDRRAAEILHCLDAVARNVDLHDLQSSVVALRPSWLPLLERPTRSQSHQVFAVGHAHIDSAWLWPIRETKRKCARTFASAVSLMAAEPDYVFVCSQAQQHAWMEEHYPALFEKMRAFAARGQFEPVGSMWVEPDTNLPSGESLVRQLVHGKRFFLDRYGVETLDCWLPDAFGYSGNLPQILQAAGVRRFLTQKLSWNEIDTFPHHTFWWEGIDGSRVLAHCPPTDTYNGEVTVGELLKGERQFCEHGISTRSLYAYGYGDGGGGPTEEMLERLRRVSDLDPLPAVRPATARAFFDSLEDEIEESERAAAEVARGRTATAHSPGRGGLPVWSGELYLERHRAVQTTQARSKLGNRRSEILLREAELWAAAALDRESAAEAAGALERAWQLVLLHQFHDILPGSSIHWVHRDSLAAYAEVAELAEEVISRASSRLAGQIAPEEEEGSLCRLTVLNAAGTARRSTLEVDPALAGASGTSRSVRLSDGRLLPVQQLANGRLLVPVEVPGSGWESCRLSAEEAAADALPHAVTVSGRTLSNGLVSVRLDGDGLVESLFDDEAGREVIAPGARGNLFQLHHDLPNHFDAWDVDQHSFEQAVDQVGVDSIEVVAEGPLRAAIRVTRPIGRASRVVQEVRLEAGARRVEFSTEVDWQERHSFLKVAFPVDIVSPHASYEIQFGHVERPTHANTSWDAARFEVPAQRWAALEEPGFGVGLLNDCKYGYDVRRNVMRLSLLRGPGWPDPEADAGLHRFTYAVLPYRPGLGRAELVEEAEALNVPLRLAAFPAGTDRPERAPRGSLLEVSGAALSAVKRADDGSGDLVVRLYEPRGARGAARLRGLPGRTATRVDLLERPGPQLSMKDGTLELELRPFELVTVRLKS